MALSQYAHPIEIFNAALSRVGEMSIQYNDGSDLANFYRGNYEGIVRDYLQRHTLNFATKVGRAVRKGEAEDYPNILYELPGDIQIVRDVKYDGLDILDYELRGDQLATEVDANALDIVYGFRAHEAEWTPDFAEAVITRLMAAIKMGPHEQMINGERLEHQADRKLLDVLGRSISSSGHPQHTKRNPLAEIKRNRYYRGRRAYRARS